MKDNEYQVISRQENGRRIESRVLEERIQAAVAQGHSRLRSKPTASTASAGRLWRAGNRAGAGAIKGPGDSASGPWALPTPRSTWGPASDDVGWLNAGATIVVHGNATNGVANAMAQGKVYVAGNIGARGMTMTKHNPRFEPPELWVLGSAGDYFGEFMAGGIAVICGHNAPEPRQHPGISAAGGHGGRQGLFRGPHRGSARPMPSWCPSTIRGVAMADRRAADLLQHRPAPTLLHLLSKREQWQCLRARTPQERVGKSARHGVPFTRQVWDKTWARAAWSAI
jgi:hypothetical protein